MKIEYRPPGYRPWQDEKPIQTARLKPLIMTVAFVAVFLFACGFTAAYAVSAYASRTEILPTDPPPAAGTVDSPGALLEGLYFAGTPPAVTGTESEQPPSGPTPVNPG